MDSKISFERKVNLNFKISDNTTFNIFNDLIYLSNPEVIINFEQLTQFGKKFLTLSIKIVEY